MASSIREALEAASKEHGMTEETVSHEQGAPRGGSETEGERVPIKTEHLVKTEQVLPVKAVPADSLAERKHAEAKEKPKEVKAEVKAEPAKTGEPQRDEKGRFTSKKFPGQWKKELQPAWEKPGGHSPEEWLQIQEEALRRETEHSANATNLQKRIQELEPTHRGFTELLNPYKDTLARRGIEPLALMKQLLAMAEYADRDFPGFVNEQARMRGLNLASLIQSQDSQTPADPKVMELERQLQQLTQTIQSSQQQSRQQTQSQIQAQVESFQSARNEDGSPKHPHFERVKVKMGHLMAADAKLTLDQAYKDACFADPEVREALLADEWDAREKKRLAELKRQEDAAKSNMGGTSGTTVVALPKGSSIRAQLNAAFDKYGGERVA